MGHKMSVISRQLDKNKKLIDKVEKIASMVEIHDSNQKAMLFGAFLQDATSHYHAMNILIEKKLYNSAFALVRVFFDAIVRGQYAIYICDDAKINEMYSIQKDWQFPKTKEICPALDAHFRIDIFEKTRASSYGMMCDYAHIGQNQIARHFDESKATIEPNFDDSLMVDTLQGNYTLMEMFAKNFIDYMQAEKLLDSEVNLMYCSHNSCSLDVYDSGKCILHSDKKDKDVSLFWKQIQDDLLAKYKCHKGQRELDGFNVVYDYVFFPAFQKDYKYAFGDHPTDEVSNFYFSNYETIDNGYCDKDDTEEEYTDKLIEKCYVEFNSCTFMSEVNLQRYDFRESLIFNNCNFEKEIYLNDTLNCYIEFKACDFKNQKLDISKKSFHKVFNFIDCRNIESLKLTNTSFYDSTSFAYTKFTTVELVATHFAGMAIFANTCFQEDTEFEYCIFDENVFFNDANICKKIDIKHAIFKKDVIFLDIKSGNKQSLHHHNLANRETARIIKHSFEKQNNIIEANKFYKLEMEKRRNELSPCNSSREWLIFWLHKISSNHSQNWMLTLFWIVVVSILGVENYDICSLCSDFKCVADYMNSVAKSFYSMFKFDKEKITLFNLLLKVTMAYLIYQLIVSIRQNTRRN